MQSATLGWLSPVRVANVEVRDDRQQIVAVIPQAAGSRSLLSLLMNRNPPDTIRITRPQLTIRVDERGSNVQELLARHLVHPQWPTASVEIVDAQVTVVDRAREATLCKIENLRATLDSRRDPRWLEARVEGDLVGAGSQAGRLKVSAQYGLPPRPGDGRPHAAADTGQVTADVDSLPLGLIRPLAARLAALSQLDGRVSGTLQLDYRGPDSDQSKFDARLTIDDLALGSAWLAGDVLRLARVQCDGTLSGRLDDVRIDKFKAQSELGWVSAGGTLPLAALSAGDAAAALRRQTVQMTAQLDLARLAQLLPHCLHIQHDTRIVSGRVQMSAGNRPGPDGAVLQSQIEVGQLKAVRAGHEIAWPQPVTVNLGLHETAGGPVIDCAPLPVEFSASGRLGHAGKANRPGPLRSRSIDRRIDPFRRPGRPGPQRQGVGRGDLPAAGRQ